MVVLIAEKVTKDMVQAFASNYGVDIEIGESAEKIVWVWVRVPRSNVVAP